MSVKYVCFSDNHGQQPRVRKREGDILVIAGDITPSGTPDQVIRALDSISALDFPMALLVPGNHDRLFENFPEAAAKLCRERNITPLIDDCISIDGKLIYGSPWQPAFCEWAFNLPSPGPIKDKWDMIPPNTDMLITHSPLYGIRDSIDNAEHLGCVELRRKVQSLHLRYHVFGHIHEGYGVESACINGVHTYVALNVSACDGQYRCVNSPVSVFM